MDVVANNYLGSTYVFGPKGNYNEGMNALLRAYTLLPQSEANRLEMALLDIKMGNFDLAIAGFQDLSEWSFNPKIIKVSDYCLEKIEEEQDGASCQFLNLNQFDKED